MSLSDIPDKNVTMAYYKLSLFNAQLYHTMILIVLIVTKLCLNHHSVALRSPYFNHVKNVNYRKTRFTFRPS